MRIDTGERWKDRLVKDVIQLKEGDKELEKEKGSQLHTNLKRHVHVQYIYIHTYNYIHAYI